MVPVATPARAFLEGLARARTTDLLGALAPEATLLAMLPGGVEERRGRDAVAARFVDWYLAEDRTTELLEATVVPVVDRVAVAIDARVTVDGTPTRIAQRLMVDGDADGMVDLHLLCSGFRPEAAPGSGATFDAGDLGCTTGLAAAFRAQLADVDLGATLTTVAHDPVALEELPSLARLLGHEVTSAFRRDDGAVEIRVVRRR